MVHITHDGKLVWAENPHRSWNSTTAYFRERALSRFGSILSEEITTMRSRSAYKDPKPYSGPAYRATIKAPYFSCFDAISDLRGYAFKNELDGFSINADYTVPRSIFSRNRAHCSTGPAATSTIWPSLVGKAWKGDRTGCLVPNRRGTSPVAK